jgi:type II secretory pathway component PulF
MSFEVQRGSGVRAPKPRKNPWVVRSFIVQRRDDHRIASYRSVVYTCFPESAEFGIGLSADEVARRAHPSFVDGVGASRAVRAEEIADFWENLGITVKGGGTETVALVRATRMAVTARMRGVLGTVRWRLNQGRDLHVALAEFPEIFSKAHGALAEAATELPPDERAEIYLSLAKTLREQASRGRKFAAAMLDQMITAAMLVVLVFITLVYFVPNFASMFRGMELDLPWPYRIADAAGKWITHSAWIAIPAIIVAAVATVMGIRRARRSANVQRWAARAPVAGPLVRALALSRSLPLFAALHKAGVHPETNFRLAGEASANALVEDFFRAAYRRCASGLDMEKAFLAERLRLGMEEGRRLAGKIEAGSELGDLEGVLRGLAEEFSERANLRIEALPKVIKPINLAAMGLVIGAMAALVGLPSMLVLEKTFQQQNQHSGHYYVSKSIVNKN